MTPLHHTRCPDCDRPISIFDESILEEIPGYISCPTCSLQFDPYTGAVYMRPQIPPGAIWLPRIIRILKFLVWVYTACAILTFTIILALAFHGILTEIIQ